MRMSRHVIVSDSWWFISKSLASNNFRQISIGLLVKTLGVWAWALSQESQVWAAFFVTCLELGRILPLFLPFLNVLCAKERTKQNVCLVSCTPYMCICTHSFCVRVCMCVYVWCNMASSFNREDRREKTPKGKDPRPKEKHAICLHSSLATDSDKSVKSHSDHCTTAHSTQLKDAHIYLSSEHLPWLWRNSKIHTACFCRHEALKVNWKFFSQLNR